MSKFSILFLVCVGTRLSFAAWYWPFGGDDGAKKRLRVSELMEPASVLIDEASDFAEDGKIAEAVDAYRRALQELDRIELENADRAQTAAFATLRNKRAYVNAAIDSLHLKQAKQNARAVAVTDTTELEKKYARMKRGETLSDEKKRELAEKKVAELEEQRVADDRPAAPATAEASVPAKDEKAAPREEDPSRREIRELLAKDPKNRRARLMLAAADMKAKDFPSALLTIGALLEERPNDAAALNLRAAVEAEQGDFRKAERTLDQSIRSNPRSHYAYYNMARLFLQTRGGEGKAAAKRYYETGRTFGGPVDLGLEALLQ